MPEHLLERIKYLEQENDDLRAHISNLKQEFGIESVVPTIFGLNRAERKVLGVLIARRVASKPQIMTALMEGRGSDEEPSMQLTQVYVCRIRAKLKPFGITIVTDWGTGWFIDAANKQKIAGYLNSAATVIQPFAELSSA